MIRLVNPFRVPSALVIATRQLEEAQRHLLDAEAERERACASVEMLQVRIERLRQRVADLAQEGDAR